ncbi:hypothetical protein ACWKT3_20845 [Streptomyces violaceus]
MGAGRYGRAVDGLFLTGTLPLKEDPKATTTSQVVQSANGWQPMTGVSVQRGDQVTVRFLSGEWTVDYRNKPMTGPTGYDAAKDRSLGEAKSCKIKPATPFGTLRAHLVGEQEFPVRVVGQRLTFRATGNSTLQLGINDGAGSCSQEQQRRADRTGERHAPTATGYDQRHQPPTGVADPAPGPETPKLLPQPWIFGRVWPR